MEYELNDIVEMKKQHPCGTNRWQITRMGADIKIKCLKCDNNIMMPRREFNKKIKKIVEKKDRYAKYILTGIFVMFSSQILGNIAVVSNIVPSTGIPLPLLSYGGSTTIVTMAALGIVYNIIKSLYAEEEQERLKKERMQEENQEA